MTLVIPHYIQDANIQDDSIGYKWDDWNVEQAEEPIDDEFYARLEGISQRAIIAFTISTAEWIVHRFEMLSKDRSLLQYLKSAWAMIVSWHYCGITWEDYADEKKWIGPVKGPLGIAMTRVHYAIQQTLENEDPELRAAWITNLAQYLITDPTPYLKWRERVMERLKRLYQLDPEEKLGEVVPRQALDPDFDLKVDQTESLINRFLSGLDHKINPFLNSPEKMLKEGFMGTPYVFNVEDDRRKRFEK